MIDEGTHSERGQVDDPRVTGDRVRAVTGSAGTVTVVGTVHDHPASVHRAAAVVDRLRPAVLALELPPLALPLFEASAEADDSDGSWPSVGGEMSAAIEAARTDRVVAIDGPSGPFLASIAARLVRERPPRDTVEGVVSGVATAGSEAIRCRIAALLGAHTSIELDVHDPVAHDCSAADDPPVQADDEDRQVRRARAVMDAFEPSRAAAFRDETREAHMAGRLCNLAREGDVVAVVGYGHLDALAERLRADLD